jgi:hypothetical protein
MRMSLEAQLREKLLKIEALFAGVAREGRQMGKKRRRSDE